MEIGVLGTLSLDGDEDALPPRDRVVLAALAVRSDTAVSAEELAEALWNGRAPTSATKIVQGCVVRLRKMLGRDAIATRAAAISSRSAATASTRGGSNGSCGGAPSCCHSTSRTGRSTRWRLRWRCGVDRHWRMSTAGTPPASSANGSRSCAATPRSSCSTHS